jgi:hypothetical protein
MAGIELGSPMAFGPVSRIGALIPAPFHFAHDPRIIEKHSVSKISHPRIIEKHSVSKISHLPRPDTLFGCC